MEGVSSRSQGVKHGLGSVSCIGTSLTSIFFLEGVGNIAIVACFIVQKENRRAGERGGEMMGSWGEGRKGRGGYGSLGRERGRSSGISIMTGTRDAFFSLPVEWEGKNGQVFPV